MRRRITTLEGCVRRVAPGCLAIPMVRAVPWTLRHNLRSKADHLVDRTTRLIIAEDHPRVAEALRRLIQREFQLVEVVRNGSDLLGEVNRLQPSLVLLDIAMPLINGIEAARRCAEIAPATKVLIVSAHDEPEYVAEAFRAGAAGYVLKRGVASELARAVRATLKGERYVSPLLGRNPASAPPPDAKGLTARQRDVLNLLSKGCTSEEIASLLHLSMKAAAAQDREIRKKLGLRSRSDLARFASEHIPAVGKYRSRAHVSAGRERKPLKAEPREIRRKTGLAVK